MYPNLAISGKPFCLAFYLKAFYLSPQKTYLYQNRFVNCMPYLNRRASYNNFILIFVFLKIALNLLAISRFGFHRDELLHLALADHLDWGYKEVPPFIAFIAKLTLTLFGDSVFGARILTTICAALIVWLTGKLTVEMGGRKFAIALACGAIIFSPSFAATGYLFQPVVFDQLWWVLTAWLMVKYINNDSSPKYLYFIGLVIGIGLLTKYTMGFFAGSLILALLFTKQRRLLWNRHVIGAALLAVLIFLPNLAWQYHHNWPVFRHMAELKKTQLDFINPLDFVKQQLMSHGIAVIIWLTGFFFLLLSFKLRKFQFLAFAFVLIFIFLMEMKGKSYYMLAAYPMLFAAGGFGVDRWVKANLPLRVAILLASIIPNLILLPVVLPVLSFKQTLAFFDYINNNSDVLKSATVWEDQQHHATTQDYADMLGWDEMAKKVADNYRAFSPEKQRETIIYTTNYGEAGALRHLGKRYNLPQPVSLASSFSLWAPPQITAKYIIYVSDTGDDDMTFYKPMLNGHLKLDSVTNTYAREKGTDIYLLEPKPEFYQRYHERFIKAKTW